MKRYLIIFLLLFYTNTGYSAPIQTGMFGLWAYGDWSKGLKVLSDNGFTVCVCHGNKMILDNAKSEKIKCIISFVLTKEMSKDKIQWQKYVLHVKETVREFRSHDALFAWYPVDEPDWREIDPDKIKEIVDIIRDNDPIHPIFTVLTRPNHWGKYLKFFDIVASDPYLRTDSTRPSNEVPQKVGMYIQKMKSDLKKQGLNKSVWIVLGAFDQSPKGTKRYAYRKATNLELSEMVSISLKEKVDGILVYTFALPENDAFRSWDLYTDPLWWEVKNIPKRALETSSKTYNP